MATLAIMLGGAVINALAFSGSKYLLSMLGGSDEERKRHDLAVEQLQAAQAEWSRRRTARLDFINEKLMRQNHAVQTFRDVDAAMREYATVTSNQLDPLGPEPQLSDYYTPSESQKDLEIAFIIFGMAATGVVAYKLYICSASGTCWGHTHVMPGHC